MSGHMAGEKVEWARQWITEKNTEAKRMNQEQLCTMYLGLATLSRDSAHCPPMGSVSDFVTLSY